MEKPVLNETPLPTLAKIYCITLGLGLLFGLSNLVNILNTSVALMNTPNAWIAWFEIGTSISLLALSLWILLDLLNRKRRFLYVLSAFISIRVLYMAVAFTLDESSGIQALGATLVPVIWAIYFNNSKKIKLAFPANDAGAATFPDEANTSTESSQQEPMTPTAEPKLPLYAETPPDTHAEENTAGKKSLNVPFTMSNGDTLQQYISKKYHGKFSSPIADEQMPELHSKNGAPPPAATKKLFCKHCGASCENSAAYCPNCGKRVRIFSRQQNKSPTTGIFLCISIVVNVLLLSALVPALITNSELEHANEGLTQNVQAITRERNLLEYENDGLTQTMNNYYDYYHFLQNNIALVIDPNGGIYHTYSCHFFKNCDSYLAYNVEQAEYKGYRPCEVCH